MTDFSPAELRDAMAEVELLERIEQGMRRRPIIKAARSELSRLAKEAAAARTDTLQRLEALIADAASAKKLVLARIDDLRGRIAETLRGIETLEHADAQPDKF